MIKMHSFHIPVMGIGFSIDTPLKVSHYGIDSVISLVDDILLEKLRKMYCTKFDIPYTEICEKTEDYRAKRITSYLDLINKLAKKKFEDFKNATIEKKEEIKEYFNLLPENSIVKQEFKILSAKYQNFVKAWNKIKDNLTQGSIDVNIMTKLDKENYKNGDLLPVEYNDAHAALRGYAKSELSSSIIFSAGMNTKLYSYIEQFEDFFPDSEGKIKKKIILKVSDYRSALVQGKLLAKKGLWVSEYRVESGLNCGGHAFASPGFLMGPILAEFKENRAELKKSIYEILVSALIEKKKAVPSDILPLKITAQGGVGTAEEHQFLMNYYQLDSVGWGSPFLLVPEATNVDPVTLNQLCKSSEEDLYLSNISPLGVPFNSMRGNTKDLEREELILKGKPGSSCPKKFLSSNLEFTTEKICTASRRFQYRKIKDLSEIGVSDSEFEKEQEKITDKSCICVGLGTSALLINNLDTTTEGPGVSVCPGPNIAYFSKISSLKEMIDHIYGRVNVITRTDRPNMFLKELTIYLDYLKEKISEIVVPITDKQIKYFTGFINNLYDGIEYYYNLFTENATKLNENKIKILSDLDDNKSYLNSLSLEIENLSFELAII